MLTWKIFLLNSYEGFNSLNWNILNSLFIIAKTLIGNYRKYIEDKGLRLLDVLSEIYLHFHTYSFAIKLLILAYIMEMINNIPKFTIDL